MGSHTVLKGYSDNEMDLVFQEARDLLALARRRVLEQEEKEAEDSRRLGSSDVASGLLQAGFVEPTALKECSLAKGTADDSVACTSFSGLPRGGGMDQLLVDSTVGPDGSSIVSGECHARHADCCECRGAKQPDEEEDFSCDEGCAFDQVLRDARAALDAARQFVTSPLLSNGPKALLAPALSPQVPPVEVEVTKSATGQVLVPESDDSTHTFFPEGPPPLPRRPPAPLPPAVSSVSSRRCSSRPPSVRAGDIEELIHDPRRRQLSALHARFGESAAIARVERARSLEATARRRREKEEREARELHEQEVAAKVRAGQERATRRAASERRSQEAERQQQAEERRLEEERQAAQRKVGQRYAKSAARRATSERGRRASLVSEILSELPEIQAQRRGQNNAKAEELQRRCENADWVASKAVVSTRRSETERRRAAAAAAFLKTGAGVGDEDENAPGIYRRMEAAPSPTPFLPRIVSAGAYT